jgi:hypothetical protein
VENAWTASSISLEEKINVWFYLVSNCTEWTCLPEVSPPLRITSLVLALNPAGLDGSACGEVEPDEGLAAASTAVLS